MSLIRTESITALNSASTNNIDLSDDGTTTFNGPVLADRVIAGSSNLQYDYRTRAGAAIIPVPSWATEIEIDFYKFATATSGLVYTLIRADLAITNPSIFSTYNNTYEQILNNGGYGAGNISSGRFGTIAGSNANVLFLFQDGAGANVNKFEYTGTIKYKKFNYQASGGGTTYVIYYVTMNCEYYAYNNPTVYGILNSQGYFYGNPDNPNDVLQNVIFGTNSGTSTHRGAFNVKFRQEDPGTLITT